jgi:hypothetical protein
MVRPLHPTETMLVGAREHVQRETEVARLMLTFWDQSWSKNLAASFLSFLWFGVGGHPVLPIGLILALQLMLPDVPAWSLWRRLQFAGRRTVTLAVLALTALFFANAQVGVLAPDGAIAYVRPHFMVPSAMGWIGAAAKDGVATHRMACSSGVAESCAILGRAYLDGSGVERDEQAAATYFEIACESGHPLACVSLGRMFSRGIGVSPDHAKAMQLYVEACQQGELVGCHNQGALQLSDGHPGSGMDALMRACSSDFGRSCYLVGEQYRLGTGGQKKSRRRAEMWLSKACRLEVSEACERLKAPEFTRSRG